MGANTVERLRQHRGVFAMDRNQIRAGLGELVDLAEQHRIRHHQMDMEGPFGELPQPGHEIRKEEQSDGAK